MKESSDKTWLSYFNDVLFEKGLITESERNKMKIRIESRPSSKVKE